MFTIVLTGGGTGGHVIPALALLPELKKYFNKIYYFGGSGIEKQLATDEGLRYFEMPTLGFNRRHLLKNFKLPFVLFKSIRTAKKYLIETKPSVVFSKGGYVSLPTVIAARRLKIPVVAHESDLSLGLANKISQKFGATIATSFVKTAELNKNFIYTGFPLRDKLFLGNPNNAREQLKINSMRPTILFTGGSSGSVAINETLADALPNLLKTYNVVHLTGKNKKTTLKGDGYFQIEYSKNIEDLFALANIVVSRAGAGAVSELAALKKSVVLIPLPKGNSRGDQVENAKLAEKYGAIVLQQENLNKNSLLDAISQAKQKHMQPLSSAANSAITQLLLLNAKNNIR
ncbi:MAG: UDP-N-acetylglucosamine--N-acetylmuramyl-(pentapeptide) pyrophosphoryl-undecaprenol N-acetylglucosamine transferase [Clostridia bacterium]